MKPSKQLALPGAIIPRRLNDSTIQRFNGSTVQRFNGSTVDCRAVGLRGNFQGLYDAFIFNSATERLSRRLPHVADAHFALRTQDNCRTASSSIASRKD